MKLQLKSLVLGLLLGGVIPVLAVLAFLYSHVDSPAVVREQKLASGKTVNILSFYLAWGIEHGERRTTDDTLVLEYVSSDENADEHAVDQETVEVFELIRPVTEQWGFPSATISVFPTTKRKGKYQIYIFSQDSRGKWKFDRKSAKVFVND